MSGRDSFPRQQARTRRFTLGAPRTFTVAGDGRRVLFLRSPGGEDPVTALWALDVATGEERCVADPRALVDTPADLPAEERARRERTREMAEGITAYAADDNARCATFAVAGRLWVADVDGGGARRLPADGPVFDPRVEPGGATIAYCHGRSLRVIGTDGAGDRQVAGEEDPDVTWGQAEFVAAEEMGRTRGHWWAPDGRRLLAARVDASPVDTWWIADPAHPDQAPVAHRYPAAGTPDATVQLFALDLDGRVTEVIWDRDAFPYLVSVTWTAAGPPLLLVERRDHRQAVILAADPDAGTTHRLAGQEDPVWVDRPDGVPAWLDGGRLLTAAVTEDTYRLAVDGAPVTPPRLHVRAVAGTGRGVTFTASPDPTTTELWHWDGGGLERLAAGGVATGVAAGGVAVIGEATMEAATEWTVRPLPGGPSAPARPVRSAAAEPLVSPAVRLIEVGPRRLRVGIVLPRHHQPGDRLPVVMSPYGGPGLARVTRARAGWLEAQWLADQGFAVVVADGRGTPGRGPAWERTIQGDFATGVLADQVEALEGAAAAVADLDASRVGIRGWSFGGYLSALAVLRRPDVFAVAVAGAPVTDWRLYDTFYTERYLGHPAENPAAYQRSSLLDDAAALSRPLLLIHGLVDDNVVAAHTLRLSQRFLEAGRPHSVLPLTGVTHLASQEEVAEHLLGLQVEFLARHLGVAASATG